MVGAQFRPDSDDRLDGPDEAMARRERRLEWLLLAGIAVAVLVGIAVAWAVA